jgi:hypothetical protein
MILCSRSKREMPPCFARFLGNCMGRLYVVIALDRLQVSEAPRDKRLLVQLALIDHSEDMLC